MTPENSYQRKTFSSLAAFFSVGGASPAAFVPTRLSADPGSSISLREEPPPVEDLFPIL
jgi:hypothetical protein